MFKAILFCIAAVTCDVVTTYVIVEVLGGKELNPIMDNVIQLGWWKFCLVKYVIGILVPLGYAILRKKEKMLFISAWLHFWISVINAISLGLYQLF